MNGKKLFQQMLGAMLIALLLAGCGGMLPGPTATPTPIPPTALVPGIDEPLNVEGVEVRLSSATKQDSYEIGMQQFSPNSPEKTILVIEAAVKAEEPEVAKEWNVSIVDTNSREVSPSQITSLKTYNDGRTEVIWVFVVKQTANSLTMQLPGGQAIPIDTLLLPSAPTTVPGDGSTSTWNNLPIMPSSTFVNRDSEAWYLFSVNATTAAVQEYYKEELSKLGWEFLRTDKKDNPGVSLGYSTILVFQKDGTQVLIYITEDKLTYVQVFWNGSYTSPGDQ
jgi:hypothetical protein